MLGDVLASHAEIFQRGIKNNRNKEQQQQGNKFFRVTKMFCRISRAIIRIILYYMINFIHKKSTSKINKIYDRC